jgi:hypothetical protein
MRIWCIKIGNVLVLYPIALITFFREKIKIYRPILSTGNRFCNDKHIFLFKGLKTKLHNLNISIGDIKTLNLKDITSLKRLQDIILSISKKKFFCGETARA